MAAAEVGLHFDRCGVTPPRKAGLAAPRIWRVGDRALRARSRRKRSYEGGTGGPQPYCVDALGVFSLR
jgi:hypothetical protein